MINIKCPYCGSGNMTADIDIRITGRLNSDGTIRVNDWWLERPELTELVNTATSEDIHGYCNTCGSYCDFDGDKGFIPYPESKNPDYPYDIQEKKDDN